jgi:hydroxyacylglutathione hydrolase
MVDFSRGPAAGDLDVRWIHGARSSGGGGTDPLIQAHRYDEHTYILRQSKAVSFEAPFMYLLFGNDRALLLDTGATEEATRFPLRATVDGIVSSWLTDHPRDGYELVVAHTHAHGDHIAGDAQFTGRPLTTVVGTGLDSVRSFFGFADWPDQVVTYDLGGRTLEITGIPGHHRRRPPSSTRGPDSCSPATRSTQVGCTASTCPRSSRAWIGWSPSARRDRSRT